MCLQTITTDIFTPKLDHIIFAVVIKKSILITSCRLYFLTQAMYLPGNTENFWPKLYPAVEFWGNVYVYCHIQVSIIVTASIGIFIDWHVRWFGTWKYELRFWNLERPLSKTCTGNFVEPRRSKLKDQSSVWITSLFGPDIRRDFLITKPVILLLRNIWILHPLS